MMANDERWLLRMVTNEVLAAGVKVRALHIDQDLRGQDTNIYLDYEQQFCVPQVHVENVRFTPDGTAEQKLRIENTVRWLLNTGTAQRAEYLAEVFLRRHEGHENVEVDGLAGVRCGTCDVLYKINWDYGWLESLTSASAVARPIRSPNDDRLQWGVPDHYVNIAFPLCDWEYTWKATAEKTERVISAGSVPHDATAEEIEECIRYGVYYTAIFGLPY